MARMIPANLDKQCSSQGERDIYKRLKDDPGSREWIVLHSLDIAHHKRQISGEIDFVVIIPTKGVLCLEVKACSKLRRSEGNWYYGNDPIPDPRGPFKQASTAMHSLRATLVNNKPDLSVIPFWSAVIFPFINFVSESGEWHSWQVIDASLYRRNSLSLLLQNIMDNARIFLQNCPTARWFKPEQLAPSMRECQEIVSILRPNFEFIENSSLRGHRLNGELQHYTEEQYTILDALEVNPRVIFTGPAGTGKTLLAIEAARRAALTGKKVLFLCFNRLLSRWIEDATKNISPGFKVTTLHKHMIQVAGISNPGYQDTYFWSYHLPNIALESLVNDNSGQYIYDEIIVDEAQDIVTGQYLEFLDLSLNGGLSSGKWFWFGDFEKQAIFSHEAINITQILSEWGLNVPIYSMRVNCRNTPRISGLVHLLGGLNPFYSKILRPDDGNEPHLIYYQSNEEQEGMLAQVLDEFYKDGFRGEDIVILSPLANSACAQTINIAPWKQRIKPYGTEGTGYIRYSTIQAFKGLEAPVIIVTDIQRVMGDQDKALFYVGITRALQRLVILANNGVKPDIIAELLHQV